MSNPIQNFFKATITQDWSIGTGNFYVSVKPTTSVGRLVVSPSSDTLREIVEYTSTGTDGNGDYIVISARGVGGTTEQTHTVGEKVRMNITAEDWEDMRDDIDSIVAAGAVNGSEIERGIFQKATDQQVIDGDNTGSTSALLVATPGQLKENYEKIVPVLRTYTWTYNPTAASTTRFDITNPTGTTFRYTWDGTGVNPVINSTTFPIGYRVAILSGNFNVGNNGVFTITGSGDNYFEVTNASGVAENDKPLSNYFALATHINIWTKPAGLKYVEIQMVGGGGASRSRGSSGYYDGGDGGAYVYKLFQSSELNSTEEFTIGIGGIHNSTNSPLSNGTASIFKTLSAGGGNSYGSAEIHAVASGGDINIKGTMRNNNSANSEGVSSMLGIGAANNVASRGVGYGYGAKSTIYSSYTAENGGDGIIIIKEYY